MLMHDEMNNRQKENIGNKINDLEYVISEKDFLDNTYIIIKRGKKNYYIGVMK